MRDKDAKVALAETILHELAIHYATLGGNVAAGEGGSSDGGGKVRVSKVPPIPIRPDVVDLRRRILVDLDRLETRLRRDVGLGPAYRTVDDRRIRAIVEWIIADLPRAVDAGLLPEIGDVIWPLWRSARKTLGLAERSYPLEALCPYCSLASLRARPEKGTVVCGNPECRDGEDRPHVWDVRNNLPVWSS